MGKWKYHITHSYKNKEGVMVNFVSQLYKVGVYGIVNNDPAMQISVTPAGMVVIEENLKAKAEKGEITGLVFGTEITVSDDTGFFEEVKITS